MTTDLYLDFDQELIDRENLEKHIDIVASMTGTTLELKEIHPTRRGFHVIVSAGWLVRTKDRQTVVNVEALTPTETVAFQLLLGSDPKREAFNIMRAHGLDGAPAFWRNRWNVLYSDNNKKESNDGESGKGRLSGNSPNAESKRS